MNCTRNPTIMRIFLSSCSSSLSSVVQHVRVIFQIALCNHMSEAAYCVCCFLSIAFPPSIPFSAHLCLFFFPSVSV